MRIKFLGLALALLAASAVARADSISYNLTLTDSNPLYSGTGSFTLASAPSKTGVTNYTPAQVTNLSFVIDGQTFKQTDAKAKLTTIQFTNGLLTDITFSDEIGTTPHRFSIATTGGYAFYYNDEQSVTSGTFSAALAPVAATPEPSSLALLGTGLFGVVGVMRKRFVR